VKAIIRDLALVTAAAALFLGAGCNTAPITTTQALGGPAFPPSDPTKVEILRTMPTRPHVRLGEIRAESSSTSTEVAKIEDAIRQKAAKLGAEAAVVVLDQVQTTGAAAVGGFLNRSIEPIQGRVILAVAIKYQ
jgi:hypothetical protein